MGATAILARYGSASFPVNSLAPVGRRRLVTNDAGQPTETEVTIDCRFELLGNGQRDLAQQQAAFEAALSIHYQDFRVLSDDGGVVLQLLNAPSLSGVRVVAGPDYPVGDGAEFATKRTVTFSLQATYPAPGSATRLRAFQESVSFSGGLPLVRFATPLAGKPIKQFVGQDTHRAVQAGSAVGVAIRPTPPLPLWPDSLVGIDGPAVQSPRFVGRAYRDFAVSWSYRFESADPLPFRGPNVWG